MSLLFADLGPFLKVHTTVVFPPHHAGPPAQVIFRFPHLREQRAYYQGRRHRVGDKSKAYECVDHTPPKPGSAAHATKYCIWLRFSFQSGPSDPKFLSRGANDCPGLQQDNPVVLPDVIWMNWDTVSWHFPSKDTHCFVQYPRSVAGPGLGSSKTLANTRWLLAGAGPGTKSGSSQRRLRPQLPWRPCKNTAQYR